MGKGAVPKISVDRAAFLLMVTNKERHTASEIFCNYIAFAMGNVLQLNKIRRDFRLVEKR
ncbi:MAG: hypothetical protein GX992_06505 [Clostridium sp.]|nr:hypothetical protein [Clostridium sp.]